MPRVLPEYRSIATSKIIEAARTLFREKGFRQTTMDEIARKLGISKAALYTYFKDKEALFKAAYESSPRELEQVIEWVVKQGDTRQAFEAFFDRMMPDSKRAAGLSFEVISEATRNPELREVLKRHNDQYLAAVERCIIATSKRKRADAKELAGSILALWNGMESLVALGFPLEETRVYWNSAMSKLVGS
ncbi:MAG TPA: TetR family transcriptional regulator [Nitrososphaerales archaeon]|nr:TetR family transcriptional regulator [Nitrososphaerales archaeon]